MYANKEANGIDWGKQWNNGISPFTGLGNDEQGNTKFNYLGAALLGGGTGLITWALARLLGLKSGPSLTAGILGALATSYYAFGKQKYGANWNPFSAEQGKGLFNNVKNQIDQKRYENTKSRVSDDMIKMRNEQMLRTNTAFRKADTGEAMGNALPMEISSDGSRRLYSPGDLKQSTTPPSATPNVEGMKKVGAARQRGKEIEAQPQAASPASTGNQNNIAARKQEIQKTKDLLDKYHLNGTNIAASLGFRTYGMPSAPNAPIDITPKPPQIGGGSLVSTH